ncbi:MAG: DMT family transporter [Brevirhabdus sp.]
MTAKKDMDAFGTVSLMAFSLLLAFNQVVIKVVNEGIQPIFFVGLRSLGAVVCLYAWMKFRGYRIEFPKGLRLLALLIGLCFAGEFVLLFLALDLTTVTRTSVIFYTMPVWMALGAHVLIPGERITRNKGIGLALAFGGVAWAIINQGEGGEGSLIGDLCALGGAMGWAALALLARGTRLREVRPELQLFYQVVVSGVVLVAIAPLFGPLWRDPTALHFAGLAFQIVVVVSAGFVFWLWLLSIYPAASVASFSFLSPIFGVGLGWLLLGEDVGWTLIGALALVAAGLVLINRPAQVPQKV